MAFDFATDEWAEAWAAEINGSEAYRKSALKWEGDFYLYVDPGPGLDEQRIIYIDLWHGAARLGCTVADESEKNPEFTIKAPIQTWKRVIDRKLDPIQGMITGRLKLTGTLSKIMRYPKAASELVNCATKVPTNFPG